MDAMNLFNAAVEKIKNAGKAIGFTDSDPGAILITGATSHVVGHRVANSLTRTAYPAVRIGVSAAELNGQEIADTNQSVQKWKEASNVALVEFDWDVPATYANAVLGVKSVLVCLPYKSTDWYWTHFPKFIDACVKEKVTHVVKLSLFKAGRTLTDHNHIYKNVPVVRAHGNLDEWLKSGTIVGKRVQFVGDMPPIPPRCELSHKIVYTIVSHSRLMSEPLLLQGRELRSAEKPTASLYGSSLYGKFSYVSPNDVAEVAVQALLNPASHYDHERTLTNTKQNELTEPLVASILSKYLKKPVTHVRQKQEEYAKTLLASGCAEFQVKDILEFEKVKSSGDEGKPSYFTTTIKEICGHEPQSFAQYLASTEDMLPFERA
jgi:hypothetical protein